MIKKIAGIAFIAALCGLLLATTRQFTAPYIDANQAQQRLAVFKALLLPDQLAELTAIPDSSPFGDCARWLALNIEQPGYAGPIEWAAVWQSATASLSMRTVRHSETPGIGDFISGAWLSDLDQFSLVAWQATDNVSGATITTRAVKRAAQQAFTKAEVYCANQ